MITKRYTASYFLAIIGLTAFELLFEARARYLYTYVPVYCILAGIGAKKIINACEIFYPDVNNFCRCAELSNTRNIFC